MLAKNIKLLCWHSFFNDFGLWAPLAILYFSHVSGSYTLGLSIFSITMISSAICEVPTGIISDRYGRVKTIIFGSLALCLAAVFYAIGINYWFLFIGAVLQGLGRSFFSGNNDAFLYDNLSAEKQKDLYAEYNGRISAMSQMALAIAGVLGGIIAYFSFNILMWVSVIPCLICFVISVNLTETKIISHQDDNIFAHIRTAFKNFISNTHLRLISIADIINFGLGEASFQFRSAFVSTLWPVWAIGFSQVLSNVGASLSFKFSGRILKRFSAVKILIYKNILNKLFSYLALIFPSKLSPVLMSANSLTFGVGTVASNKLLQDEFSTKERATMGSLNSLAGSIFFSIFAIILGSLADKFGPRIALIIETTLAMSVIFIYLKLKKLFLEDEHKNTT